MYGTITDTADIISIHKKGKTLKHIAKIPYIKNQ
jgi:hypothetical protein